METKESTTLKDQRVYGLLVLYDMQTRYFLNVIEGISDEDAQRRLETKANHIGWLTGSLVQQRYEMANILGIPLKQAADDLFKDYQGIQDHIVYPPLSTFKKDWERITPELKDALVNVSKEKMDSTFEMEGMKMTHYDLLAFTIYREANCIGQIALWRRLLGYPAMRYD